MARVLIIEPGTSLTSKLLPLLDGAGHEVVSRASIEALQFSPAHPDVGLVIFRTLLGRELEQLSRSLASMPALPWIVVTQTRGSEPRAAALRAGASDCICYTQLDSQLLPSLERAICQNERSLAALHSRLPAQSVDEPMPELVATRAELVDFLNTAGEPIQCTSQEHQFFYVNQAWLALLGYAAADLGRLVVWDVLAPESHATYLESIERIKSGAPNARFEITLAAAEGQRIDVAGSMTGYVRRGGLNARAIFHDVTERNRALRELDRYRRGAELRARQTTGELEQVFRASGGAFRVLDTNFTVLRANEAMASITGLSVDEMVGKKCFDTFPGAECGTERCTVRRILRGDSIHGIEVRRYATGQRSIPCQLNARPLHYPDRNSTIIIEEFRDISDTKRLQAIADSVSVTENVGYVVSGIRHELGNPVNSLKTTLAVLRLRLDRLKKEDIVEYLDRCERDLGRMEFILRSLRSLNMFEQLELQSVNLAIFLRDFCRLIIRDIHPINLEVAGAFSFGAQDCHSGSYSALARVENPHSHPALDTAGHARRSESEGDLAQAVVVESESDDAGATESWMVEVDPLALQQVMLNLVTNAKDALAQRPLPLIRIVTEGRQNLIAIAVEDNGCGMTSQQLKDLFKPLHTTKRHGTGLGLTLVRKALARMGGTVDIASEEDKGTRALILLPRSGGSS